MPELRKQEQAVRSELESLRMAAQDQARYLRVVDSLANFRARLQGNAERLDFDGRRKIIRLLAKEILVGRDTITIRHSIPPANSPPKPTDPSQPSAGSGLSSDERYRLCTRGSFTAPREHLPALQLRPLGERLAPEVGARRGGGRPLCGRCHPGISVSDGR